MPNEFLYEWGAIVGNLLLRQGLSYGIGGMYIEFCNVASPGDTVPPPTFTRDADQGIAYYDALAESGNQDYLRVPLTAGTLLVSDETNFPYGNQPTFFAMTQGLVGVNGLPFSDINNSVVYGGALVSFVDANDPTQDLILSRFYSTTAAQQPKLPNSQVGFEWQITLE
jgi:hypothetical protein